MLTAYTTVNITWIDITIVLAAIAFIAWSGFRARSSDTETEDYFLAGRSLTWPFIGLSLFASNLSSSSIIGLTSSGYSSGISVFNYEWMGSLLLIFFAFFIVPRYLQHRLFTMPEFLEHRFDGRVRVYFSFITIIANIVIDTAGILYAGALVFNLFFPETDLLLFIIGLALLSGLYTMTGGLRAVVRTDMLQGILLASGATILSILVIHKAGSWEHIRAALPPGHLDLVQPSDDRFLPWPTILISLPILSFYFICTNQFMVQRVLGAKTVDDGRKGALFAGLLKLTVLFIMIMPGTVSRLLYPNLENPNMLFPRLLFDLLPTGVLGLVMTGFVAALMSSIDSALNAASTLVTLDLYKKWKPQATQKQLIYFGRTAVLVFVVLASAWAPMIRSFPTLWEYLQAALSYLTPPVVACFLLGLFWKKATARGALSALAVGNITAGLLLVNQNLQWWPPIHYLYAATVIFAVSMVVLVGVSLLVRSPASASESPIRPAPLSESALPWYRDYRSFAALLTLCIGILIVLFW